MYNDGMITWHSREFIDSTTELVLPEIMVCRNRVPGEKCGAANAYILGQEVRKVSLPLADPECELPPAIAELFPYVPFLGEGNELIYKWYLPGGNSDAFKWHQDHRIGTRVLGTMGGCAVYSTIINGIRYDIETSANTFVIAHDDFLEKVTHPDEPRSFIFNGYNPLLPEFAN